MARIRAAFKLTMHANRNSRIGGHFVWVAGRHTSAAAAIFIGFLFNVELTGTASAHVKWFCGYDVASQPKGLENVLCLDLEF